MKRFACLCGGLAVLVAAQSATAQVVTTNAGLTIWYDVRPTVAAVTTAGVGAFGNGQNFVQFIVGKGNVIENLCAGNAGGPGDGQVLRISPRLRDDPGPFPTGFGLHVTKNAGKIVILEDNSVGNIYAYITVGPNGAGLDQVISALGRDTDVIKQGLATAGNKIESILLTPDTAQWSAGGTSPSPSALATQVGEDFSMSAKSVKIPVAVGPVYDATGGAIPTGVYRVACLQVTAAAWNKPPSLGDAANPGIGFVANSTYLGNDGVNNLLMTRAVSSGGPAPAEDPDFGYTTVNVGDVEGNLGLMPDPLNQLPARTDFVTGSNGGTPEANSGGDGSTIGTTSIEADFDIIVQMKGDYNHDGLVTALDTGPRNATILATVAGTVRQREVYLGDFNNDGVVNSVDGTTFNKNITASAAGDCNPVTGDFQDCPPSPCGGANEPPCASCPAP